MSVHCDPGLPVADDPVAGLRVHVGHIEVDVAVVIDVPGRRARGPAFRPRGGGLRADSEQKQEPGERILAKRKEGLTNQGPLQKPA